MKIAVSFLSVVTIAVALGAVAVYIIWITRACEDIGHFRCVEDGSCIPFTRLCNRQTDCPNRSDEVAHECADLTGLDRQLQRMVEQGQPVRKAVSCRVSHPKDCKCNRPFGVWCEKLSWTKVPWEEFDSNMTALIMNNALSAHGSYAWREQVASLRKLRLLIFMNQPDAVDFPSQILYETEELAQLQIDRCSVGRFPPLQNLSELSKVFITNCSVEEPENDSLSYLPNLRMIDLSHSKLQLNNFSFRGLPKLYDLALRDNRIQEIRENMLKELPELEYLDLRQNLIRTIDQKAFWNNKKLITVLLSQNRLVSLHSDTFKKLALVQKLDVGFNPLNRFSANTFCGLNNTSSLNMGGVELENIDLEIFSCMKNLTYVHFKRFEFCRYVPHVPKCYPLSNGLTSRMNLLDSTVLRLIIWVIATLTVFGNMTVIVSRCWNSRAVGKVDVFINNLAVADILTGVYLITLALKDIQMRNSYTQHAFEWTTSWQCTAIGILAMISCEVSLLILTMMSLERYLVISGPFAAPKLGRTLAFTSMAIIWIFVTGLALTPLIQWRGKTSFYGSSDLCFPLHMDEPHAIGWEYSAFVFIGLNSMCLIAIATCYGKLFWVVRKTRLSTPIFIRDMEMALRFFLMVVSDFVCWAPVILLKVAVLYGYEIRQDVHAWLLIFVIPLNSAVNPFLYTFSTGSVRSQFLQQLLTAIGRINHSHRDEIHVLRNAGTLSDTPLYNSVLSK